MTRSKSSSTTIRDVAKKAAVSVATVSRYINRNAPVSPEVASRLDSVMKELNYVPHATARSLATNKTSTLGLLLMDIHGDFFAPLLSGVEAAASQHGYDLLISSTRQPQRRLGSPLPLGPHNTDGLLIFANSLDETGLRHLHDSSFPIVLIHQTPPPDICIPCVTVENKAASCNLVEHLIQVHGRRRLVLLRGPQDQQDSYWREQGYLEALQKNGLPFDPSLVAAGEFDREIAHESVRKLVEDGIAFDAVFTGDDEAAVGALAALREAGRRVPEDVSVAGFDDQRMSPYLTPPLTTVRAPTELVGKTAVQQLTALIRSGSGERLTLLPTELVIRRSCGCN